MATRVVLSDNIWFIVEETVKELSSLFESNSKTMIVHVIDDYEASIVKDRIACFVDVIVPTIEDQIDLINIEESVAADVHQ
jgi:hypothetical protein